MARRGRERYSGRMCHSSCPMKGGLMQTDGQSLEGFGGTGCSYKKQEGSKAMPVTGRTACTDNKKGPKLREAQGQPWFLPCTALAQVWA